MYLVGRASGININLDPVQVAVPVLPLDGDLPDPVPLPNTNEISGSLLIRDGPIGIRASPDPGDLGLSIEEIAQLLTDSLECAGDDELGFYFTVAVADGTSSFVQTSKW